MSITTHSLALLLLVLISSAMGAIQCPKWTCGKAEKGMCASLNPGGVLKAKPNCETGQNCWFNEITDPFTQIECRNYSQAVVEDKYNKFQFCQDIHTKLNCEAYTSFEKDDSGNEIVATYDDAFVASFGHVNDTTKGSFGALCKVHTDCKSGKCTCEADVEGGKARCTASVYDIPERKGGEYMILFDEVCVYKKEEFKITNFTCQQYMNLQIDHIVPSIYGLQHYPETACVTQYADLQAIWEPWERRAPDFKYDSGRTRVHREGEEEAFCLWYIVIVLVVLCCCICLCCVCKKCKRDDDYPYFKFDD